MSSRSRTAPPPYGSYGQNMPAPGQQYHYPKMTAPRNVHYGATYGAGVQPMSPYAPSSSEPSKPHGGGGAATATMGNGGNAPPVTSNLPFQKYGDMADESMTRESIPLAGMGGAGGNSRTRRHNSNQVAQSMKLDDSVTAQSLFEEASAGGFVPNKNGGIPTAAQQQASRGLQQQQQQQQQRTGIATSNAKNTHSYGAGGVAGPPKMTPPPTQALTRAGGPNYTTKALEKSLKNYLGERDSLIPKFNPARVVLKDTPTITIYGGTNQGKSSIIFNLLYHWRNRFDLIIVMSPTFTARNIYARWTPRVFVRDGFEPDMLVSLLSALEAVSTAFGMCPRVGLVFDDLFAEDDTLKNHSIFQSLYKRGRHFDLTIFEAKHAFVDTKRANRASAALIGVMTLASSEMVSDAYDMSFKQAGNFDKETFQSTLKQLAGKGCCLFIDQEHKMSFFPSIHVDELPPFSLCHPDVYVLLHYYLNMQNSRAHSALHPLAQGGLVGLASFRQAYGISDDEYQQETGPAPPKVTVIESSKAKQMAAKKGFASSAAAQNIGKIVIMDGYEDELEPQDE